MQSGKTVAAAAATLLMACHPAEPAAQLSTATEVDSVVSVAEPVRAPIACPAQTFEEFLQAFAADEHVRNRFTASEVQVTDWRNADEPSEGTKVNQVPKADYNDFTLRFENGAFHNVAADGTVDPDPQKVEVVKKGDGYSVSYVYGMSEGNSWTFIAKDQCWVLAEDPEPSSI